MRKWIRRYQALGVDGLKNHLNWKNYTREIKLKAILEYENGISMNSIIDKYDISDKSVLKRWIKKYNSHKELKDSRGENSTMTKGRKLSFKEKLEKQGITQSMSRLGKCIDNGPMKGYQGTLKS